MENISDKIQRTIEELRHIHKYPYYGLEGCLIIIIGHKALCDIHKELIDTYRLADIKKYQNIGTPPFEEARDIDLLDVRFYYHQTIPIVYENDFNDYFMVQSAKEYMELKIQELECKFNKMLRRQY